MGIDDVLMEGLSTVVIDDTMYEMWDSLKLRSYSCETRGKYAMEEHLVPTEPSEALAFGIAMHKAIEVWTNDVMLGGICEAGAVLNAEAAALEAWEAELPQELREMLELSGDRRSYANLKRLFKFFRQQYPLSYYKRVLEVEEPFALPLGKTSRGVNVAWCGKRDRVVELALQEGIYVTDIKTSTFSLDSDFFEAFKRSSQMLGYAWAGKQQYGSDFAGILIQAIQVQAPLKTRSKPAHELVQSDTIQFSDSQIEEWRDKTLHKIDSVYRARERGKYAMDNGELCTSYNRACAFARICNAEPASRPAIKKSHYKERVWNPMTMS